MEVPTTPILFLCYVPITSYRNIWKTWPSSKKYMSFSSYLNQKIKIVFKTAGEEKPAELKLGLRVCSMCSPLILKRIHKGTLNDEKNAINAAQFVSYHLTLQNMPELIRSKSQVCDLRHNWSMKFTTKLSYSFEMKELYYPNWPILSLTPTEN